MKLYFRKFGQGPKLIILHGLYGSSDNWQSIANQLAEHFEVYTVDQRNHGQSPHSDVHNYHAMKEDILEFMDDNNIETASVIGHSMGGKAAMFFASDYPERIDALILLDIAPKHYGGTKIYIENITMHREMLETLLNLDLSKVSSRNEVDAQLQNTIPKIKLRQFLLKNLERDANQRFRWRINLKVLAREIENILAGLEEKKYMPGFQSFSTLFIGGEKSNFILEEDRPLMQKVFPGAEITTIPEAGHWLHAEQPELLVKVIIDFLKRNVN